MPVWKILRSLDLLHRVCITCGLGNILLPEFCWLRECCIYVDQYLDCRATRGKASSLVLYFLMILSVGDVHLVKHCADISYRAGHIHEASVLNRCVRETTDDSNIRIYK